MATSDQHHMIAEELLDSITDRNSNYSKTTVLMAIAQGLVPPEVIRAAAACEG